MRVAGIVWLVLLTACGGGQLDAPFPRPVNSRFGRVIAQQLPRERLVQCDLPSVPLGEGREVRPIDMPSIVIRIASSWQYADARRPTTENRRYLDGTWGPVWEWPGGKGIGLSPYAPTIWFDYRTIGADLSPMVVQLGRTLGYRGVAPGDFRMANLRECGDWAGDYPVRVLLFELVGPDPDDRLYGVSAYWKTLTQPGAASLVGVGGHREAWNEFLTMIRLSR